ncbi:MAG: zinc transporter ZupT [Candidatus Krumholzibacteria bacterium]|nr:zinc transporter ZupT [Candidatus Krumholzibacteria bacterium]
MNGDVAFAFLLTALAGLSTGVGSAIAFLARHTNKKLLCLSLGFSAGVMIYVSMIELLGSARVSLIAELGTSAGGWITIISFFGGMLIVAMIDRLVPSYENPHELHMLEELSDEARERNPRLMRMGVLSAIAIAVHNLPEGMATFAAALKDPALGVSIAIAIAIHNIPEGIAVSVPIFYATGNRKKAFTWSFLSGLAEPAGAVIGYLLLRPFLSETVFGVLFASVAGIMVFISFDELLPAAEEYGEHHVALYGLLAGMAIMAVSLVILQ